MIIVGKLRHNLHRHRAVVVAASYATKFSVLFTSEGAICWNVLYLDHWSPGARQDLHDLILWLLTNSAISHQPWLECFSKVLAKKMPMSSQSTPGKIRRTNKPNTLCRPWDCHQEKDFRWWHLAARCENRSGFSHIELRYCKSYFSGSSTKKTIDHQRSHILTLTRQSDLTSMCHRYATII